MEEVVFDVGFYLEHLEEVKDEGVTTDCSSQIVTC
jgi:hypothetical protein